MMQAVIVPNSIIIAYIILEELEFLQDGPQQSPQAAELQQQASCVKIIKKFQEISFFFVGLNTIFNNEAKKLLSK